MAQVVGYYEDDVVFTEGPFVICNPFDNGWRVEAEMKGYKCPVLPDCTIYTYMNDLGYVGKTNIKQEAEAVCDALNAEVRCGKIILKGRSWIWPEADEQCA